MRSVLHRAILACTMYLIAASGATADVQYTKYTEPNEKAFTALVPAGWQTVGGIVRWPPNVAGAMNAVEAKVDFTLKSDAAGTIMAHWLPDVNFVDMTGSPAGGMFPPGSQCNGCIVMPRLGPVNYLLKVVLPRTSPQARNVKVLGSAEIPEVEKGFDQLRAMLQIPLPLVYKAFIVGIEYTEGNVRYRQIMFAVIEDSVKLGLGTWKSRSTMLFRAPADQFDKALPILTKVQGSVQINNEWLAGEMKGAEERTGQVKGVFDRIRKLDDDIVSNRAATNAAIQKQMQRILTKVD
jgi:hypothetical protein